MERPRDHGGIAMTSRWTVALALVAVLVVAPRCDGGEPADGEGTLTLGLALAPGSWFRMRLYHGAVDEAAEGAFDTQCQEWKGSNFQLSKLEPGDDRTVLFEAFDSATCEASTRVQIGLRGGITVTDTAEQNHYYIPIYPDQSVSEFPKDISISGSTAVKLDFCKVDAPCDEVGIAPGICKQLVAPGQDSSDYWCVPTCDDDTDCQGLHPGATCDLATRWCVMTDPFPLNLSEGRALGHADTSENGDVVFMGGFGSVVDGQLVTTSRAFERFDAATGVFAPMTFDEPTYPSTGLAGYGRLEDDWAALVGGVTTAQLTISGTGGGMTLNYGGLGDEVCDGEGTCVANGSTRITLLHLGSGAGILGELTVPRIDPTVVSLGDKRFVVLGGWVPTGVGTAVQKDDAILLCTYDDNQASCASVGNLTGPRAGAAAACYTDTCEQILVVGGSTTPTTTGEILMVSGDTVQATPITGEGLPASLSWPRLCGNPASGLRLVGGSSGVGAVGGLQPSTLSIEGNVLQATALEWDAGGEASALPAVAAMADGTCWIGGGINGAGQVSGSLLRVTDTAVAADGYDLHEGRFGAMAAAVGSGPLAGSVLVGGGLTFDDAGGATTVRGAELLRP